MSAVAQSPAHAYYEVALFGEFFARDLKLILNRLTLHTESAAPMHTREIVFEHIGAQGLAQSGPQGDDPVLLKARKELGDGKESGWTLYSYLKPESIRVHPEATVRPWAVCEVLGDALSFASALGYARRSQIYKRGYAFRRGPLVIQMFQQEQVDPKTSLPIPAHADTLWEVEVKTATQVNTAVPAAGQVQVNTVRSAVDAVLEVQYIMKAKELSSWVRRGALFYPGGVLCLVSTAYKTEYKTHLDCCNLKINEIASKLGLTDS